MEPTNEAAGRLEARRRSPRTWVAWIVVIAGFLFMLNLQQGSYERLDELSASLERANTGIASLEAKVGELDARLQEASAASAAPTIDIPTTPAGYLPPFDRTSGVDAAIGMAAPAFEGVSYYDGSPFSFDPGSKLTLLVIGAPWCPYCRDEFPLLSALLDSNPAYAEAFDVVGVVTAEDLSRGPSSVEWLDSGQFAFTNVIDADRSIASRYGVTAFPYFVFVGPDGNVMLRTAGAFGEGQLESALDALLDLTS